MRSGIVRKGPGWGFGVRNRRAEWTSSAVDGLGCLTSSGVWRSFMAFACEGLLKWAARSEACLGRCCKGCVYITKSPFLFRVAKDRHLTTR